MITAAGLGPPFRLQRIKTPPSLRTDSVPWEGGVSFSAREDCRIGIPLRAKGRYDYSVGKWYSPPSR